MNKSLSTLTCVSRQVYEPARAWGGLGRVCPAVTPDAVRSTNAKGRSERRMTVKQKREKELGYPMWVLGPGPMMMRLFLPDVRRTDPDPSDGAAEASKATPKNRNKTRGLSGDGEDEIG